MRRVHALAWGAVLTGAIALRLALFSGYGLGDDPGYLFCYHAILRSGAISPLCAYDFRFAFWIPVVGLMRLLGVSDASWVGFVTVCSIVNVVLVWLLARQDGFGRGAALAAMALMAVLPLEVLCATLFVIDVPLATWCFLAFWLYRASLRAPRPRAALGLAAASGAVLFLGYSTKQWAVLVGVLFALEALREPRRTWAASATCVATFLALVGAYFAWQWRRFGSPIYDIRLVRSVAAFLPHSREILLDYPRMLLAPTEYGTRFAGFYPHATALLAVAFAGRTRRAGKWLLYFVLLLAALAATPSHRDAEGRWVVLVPHIFRYLCFVSIPLCLALAGYVRELVAWRPAAGVPLLAVFLGVSVAQAVRLTAPTRDSFAEQRRAIVALRAFSDERVYSDVVLVYRYLGLELQFRRPERAVPLYAEDPAARAVELAKIADGVVVTGGARLPWYGCHRCTANLGDLPVPRTWRLVATLDGGPRTPYRAEPLRIWRVSAAVARADELLAVAPDAAARAGVLERAVAMRDDALAEEVGERLLAAGEGGAAVAHAAGMAAFRAGHPTRAQRYLGAALAAGLPDAARREARAALALIAARAGDHARARRELAAWRAESPGAAVPAELRDVESGLGEGVAAYQETRLLDARAAFARCAARPDVDRPTRRRARYFLALTLYRLGRIPEAAAEAAAYRAAYGDDEASRELRFREGEALRVADPAAARAAWAALIDASPGSPWAAEARRALDRLR
jgi:hypothetical protein